MTASRHGVLGGLSSMQQPEKFVWLTILVAELTFIVLTRFVVARFPAFSVDAELIRTVLRLAAVVLFGPRHCSSSQLKQ
jgi:hypothetical protein